MGDAGGGWSGERFACSFLRIGDICFFSKFCFVLNIFFIFRKFLFIIGSFIGYGVSFRLVLLFFLGKVFGVLDWYKFGEREIRSLEVFLGLYIFEL